MSIHKSYTAAKIVAQNRADETRETWAVYRVPQWPSGAHADAKLSDFEESSLSTSAYRRTGAYVEPVYPTKTVDDLSATIADLKRRVSLLEKRLSDDG